MKNFIKNQVHIGQRPARTWFLEIAFVHDIGMSVCVCPQHGHCNEAHRDRNQPS